MRLVNEVVMLMIDCRLSLDVTDVQTENSDWCVFVQGLYVCRRWDVCRVREVVGICSKLVNQLSRTIRW